MDAIFVDDYDFTRLHIAHEFRTDRVERTALARQYKAVSDPAQAERADAVRVADADELILRQQNERIAAANDIHHRANRVNKPLAALPCNQAQDDLCIDCRLENRAVLLHLRTQGVRVDEVAVMRHRQHTDLAAGNQRLCVDDVFASEGRIAHMTNRDFSLQSAEDFFIEYLRHKSEVAIVLDALAVRDRDARALLTAVLQSKQTVISGFRRVDMLVLRVNTEYAAVLLHLISAFLDIRHAASCAVNPHILWRSACRPLQWHAPSSRGEPAAFPRESGT